MNVEQLSINKMTSLTPVSLGIEAAAVNVSLLNSQSNSLNPFISIGAVCRVPNINITAFSDNLRNFIISNKLNINHIILKGDFNIDLCHQNKNPPSRLPSK